MSLSHPGQCQTRRSALLAAIAGFAACLSAAQTAPPAQITAPQQPGSQFQGSVATGEASAQPIDLSLDDAIQRGLKNNLGIILSGTQAAGRAGQRLSQLQSLLPSVDFNAKEPCSRSICPPRACAFPAFPPSSGPSATRTCAPRSAGRWSM